MNEKIEKLAEDYYIELNKNNKYDDNYLSKNKTIRDFTEGFNIAVEIKQHEINHLKERIDDLENQILEMNERNQ